MRLSLAGGATARSCVQVVQNTLGEQSRVCVVTKTKAKHLSTELSLQQPPLHHDATRSSGNIFQSENSRVHEDQHVASTKHVEDSEQLCSHYS